MTLLDDKINTAFSGLVVRKDLVKEVRGNAIVPSYVLEFLLGQYCATNDEDSIRSGIETVKEILLRHYVHRNEAGLIRSNIRERGRWKVIDKISVALNDKTDAYEASFSNLGIKQVPVASDVVKAHPKLLVSGIWCIADVEYEHSEESGSIPWALDSLKPIQLSNFDFYAYVTARDEFSTDEWIDLLIQTIGFDPEKLGRRGKMMQLLRLIPFIERNYNLIELGPKGTGKSHVYSEFSPHGILISGGEVTVPKLFVNNSNGKIGLVGYWDVVAFDEFAGKQKKVDKALVDIMKNYLANKSFSRGIETLGAEASMAFIGNTKHSVPFMLKHSDLFEELPDKYYDSAFIDRLHNFLPGWEVDIIRGELFSSGYGFIVDYLAEILRHLRGQDFSDKYRDYFTLSPDISTRDRDGVNKTFSGLMKLIYPSGVATEEEIKDLLTFAMEGRKRVKDQLMRIDSTYAEVDFHFVDKDGTKTYVKTLEEQQHSQWYYRRHNEESEAPTPLETPVKAPDVTEEAEVSPNVAPISKAPVAPAPEPEKKGPEAGHVTFRENQKGITYDEIFGPWIAGSKRILVVDPYIRTNHQIRNMVELLETVDSFTEDGEEVEVFLATKPSDFPDEQAENLQTVANIAQEMGIQFKWKYEDGDIHARYIQTDTGWKISLDRGLDIYQWADFLNGLSPTVRKQKYRSVRPFEVTYILTKDKMAKVG